MEWKKGELIFDSYEIKKYLETDANGISMYEGYDDNRRLNVLIKTYPLPKDKALAGLTKSLWNREIRYSHIATSSVNAGALLKILDARVSDEYNKLVLITEFTGFSLRDHREKTKRTLNDTLETWMGFRAIIRALHELHNVGIIHRNLNPGCIYYNDSGDEEAPLFRIGDFSWSIYVHGWLKTQIEELFRKREITIFTPPEHIIAEYMGSESFVSDIYSLGMILAYSFITKFKIKKLKNIEEYQKEYVYICQKIEKSDLSKLLKELIEDMVVDNPNNRLTSLIDVDTRIEQIISTLESENIPEAGKRYPIDMWVEDVVKKFTERGEVDVNEVLDNTDQFLEKEFINAKAYVDDKRESQLIIVTETNRVYIAKPWYNKREQEERPAIAKLIYWPSGRFIPRTDPILILKKGVRMEERPWEYHGSPSWAKFFTAAKKTSKARIEHETLGDLIQHFKVLLDAQRAIDTKYVYPYRRVFQKGRDEYHKPRDSKERIVVKIESEYESHQYGRIKTASLYDFENDLFKEGSFECEISNRSNPYDKFEDSKKWDIEDINVTDETLTLSRKKKQENASPSETGYLRPWFYSYSVPLFYRKRNAIASLKGNGYLQEVLRYPGMKSIFCGSDAEYSEIPTRIANSLPIFLVQGPPGTGKTWLATETAIKIIQNDPASRILITAKDHEPLNHLLEEFVSKADAIPNLTKPLITRYVSPEREQRLSQKDVAYQYRIQEVSRNILIESLERIEKSNLSEDLKTEWKEYIESELEHPSTSIQDTVRRSSNVYFTTSTSSILRRLAEYPPFDWVIFEEAGKAYPTELLIPLLIGHRWVMIGDQNQLPPYKHHEVLSAVDRILENRKEEWNDEEQFEEFKESVVNSSKFFNSLFDRIKGSQYPYLHKKYGPPIERLHDQYRMPPIISDMISSTFYGTKFNHKKGKIEATDPFVEPRKLLEKELVWIDTPYCSESRRAKERSRYINDIEVDIIEALLKSFKPVRKFMDTIAILSPYKEQVNEMKKRLRNIVTNIGIKDFSSKCYTVDSFQGRQADIVIVSLVRNNSYEDIRRAIGFLTSPERLNVTLSRTRKRLFVIGSLRLFETYKDVNDMEHLYKIIEFVKANGKIVDSSELGVRY